MKVLQDIVEAMDPELKQLIFKCDDVAFLRKLMAYHPNSDIKEVIQSRIDKILYLAI